jgi:hypothetical protein
LALAQAHAKTISVFVNEFDAGTVRCPPCPPLERSVDLASFCQNLAR